MRRGRPKAPGKHLKRAKQRRRDLHAFNEDGMLVCNPRDREAAHRAQVEGIATENAAAITCKKCRARQAS